MKAQASVWTCAAFLVFLHSAQAADIEQLDSDTISITGEIEFGDDQKFINLALVMPNVIVVLSSPGGNLDAAIKIGKAIRLKGLATAVSGSEECASACGLIWLAGLPRFLSPGSRVGFHAAYDLTEGFARERGVANALVGAYLGSLGLSESAVIYITLAPPDSMQWLTLADAAQIGIEVRSLDLAPNVALIGPDDQPSLPTGMSVVPMTALQSFSIYRRRLRSALSSTIRPGLRC